MIYRSTQITLYGNAEYVGKLEPALGSYFSPVEAHKKAFVDLCKNYDVTIGININEHLDTGNPCTTVGGNVGVQTPRVGKRKAKKASAK